jgi:hypothetical protein
MFKRVDVCGFLNATDATSILDITLIKCSFAAVTSVLLLLMRRYDALEDELPVSQV